MRKFSSKVLDGPDRAPSRAMLYPVGFNKEDFSKPKVGVASTWSQVTPCNFHIDALAKESAKGVDAAGGKSVIFNTITISDGISMGTEGMKYSLVSREVIADSIETVVGCEGMDGYVAIGGCDKNMPGCIMAMARMNRPSVFVYGGTILPGCATVKGEEKDLDIVSVFEAVGKHANGEFSDEELQTIEEQAIPGPGSCGGMYTANTMASAIEALGMSLPNSSAQTAIGDDKKRDSFDAGAAVLHLLERGITPRDIMTREAFENAITVVITLGGSTNAVLHLLAMAHSADVELSIDDFTEIGKRVPVLADLKPSGKYVMAELVKIGGIIPLMKMLLAFMEKNQDKPFLLNYWMFSVHAPFDAKPKVIDKYRALIDPKDPQRSPTYAAMVEAMDDAVGTLIDALDRLKIADNTIIVFFSDNGGNMYNEIDGTSPTSNFPLRGGKAAMFEGGVRVPMIVAWPGNIAADTRNDALVQSTDFFPTFLDLLPLKKE
ncbi:dihydroxy-acid dehydratase, partial [Akkermansiaceae bacterium]|nr:dihydroxy-acid dehydratase [Akkermansiaceae bacterium]